MRAHETGLFGVFKHPDVFALFAPDNGAKQSSRVPSGRASTVSIIWSTVCWLISLPHCGQCGTPMRAYKKAQVVADFGYCAYGRTGVIAGGFLVDADGGGQAVNGIHIGLVHYAQKLAGIAGHTFNIASLSLGVNGIKSKGRLTRARQSREDY